jgi:uncharacterized protein YjiS (DUF1127 family)
MSTLTLTLPLTRFGHGFGRALSALAARAVYLRKLHETRRYVAQMDDHMLSDIGVSRAQVNFELDRARGLPLFD